MRILITGVSGFAGGYLSAHIADVAPDAEIWGLVLPSDPGVLPNHVKVVYGNLTEPHSMAGTLEQVRPDLIFHLAGATSVASSWEQPDQAFQVNLVGTVNLFEALRKLDVRPRVVVASSAEVYGKVPLNKQPITERQPLRPLSPYGSSKAGQDLVAAQYFDTRQLPCVRLRLFHHTGPRRPGNFVASSFARQIARIEYGLEDPVVAVGNLEAVRDITDVRDIARAYWLAATTARAGEVYNVCSGNGIFIRSVLEKLLALSDHKIEIRQDLDRMRAVDIPHLVGDHSRFTADTGWNPEIPLETTLRDLLDWWRDNVQRSNV
jgi:GDP-4-dehydro-6-deoxy-D-mannose reductase